MLGGFLFMRQGCVRTHTAKMMQKIKIRMLRVL
jgi:hypothetical protein